MSQGVWNTFMMTASPGLARELVSRLGPDVPEFRSVCQRMASVEDRPPITLQAAPLRTPEEMLTVHQQLRLVVFERDLHRLIVTHRKSHPRLIPSLGNSTDSRWPTTALPSGSGSCL